jgi:uncharacterized membrane protein YheB (UPF0754 family)
MPLEKIIRPASIIFIGALIGWITNYIAIKMLFRPHNPVGLGLFKIQGLIPKRKHELSERIANIVVNDLMSLEDIKETLKNSNVSDRIAFIIDDILDRKLNDMLDKYFPFAKMFLSPDALTKLKVKIRDEILSHKDEIIDAIVDYSEGAIDIKAIIIKNVDNLSLDELEKITYSLAKKELKHIEFIGAILGAIIGFFQYMISLYW